MPHIHFVNDDLEVEIDEAVTLPQVAQEVGASIPFGCRAGTCGACVLTVEAGMETVEEKGFVEDDTLHVLGLAGPHRRLGCQMILRGGGSLRVKW